MFPRKVFNYFKMKYNLINVMKKLIHQCNLKSITLIKNFLCIILKTTDLGYNKIYNFSPSVKLLKSDK